MAAPALMQLAFATHVNQSVRILCLHKIPDLINAGKTTSKELAEATGLHEPTLYRVVRASALGGVLTYDEGTKSFALTEAGQLLRSDHPQSLAAMFLFLLLPSRLQAYEKFEEMVKTGTNCMTLATGGDFFAWCQTHPEDRRIFDEAMSQTVSGAMHDLMATSVPLDGVKVIMDVGGGVGKLAHRLVQRAPEVKAICFDLPVVVAESSYKDHEVTMVGGDFFDASTLPKDADAVVMATVLHDWSDEHCATILKNVRSVLPTGGKLFISEHIVSNEPSPALCIDIEMLLLVTGRERNQREFEALASAAGFKFVQMYNSPTRSADVLEFVAI